jgi:DUF4097 and DUF4098 domain-containing protein YvlB
MTRRTLAITAVVLALLATCGLSFWVTYVTVQTVRDELAERGAQVRLFERADRAGEVVETRTFRANTPVALAIDSSAGDVRVRAADVREVQVAMTKRAWGATGTEALAAARALSVTIQQQGDRVALTYRHPERIVIGGARDGTDTVSFAVTVPLRTDASLATGFGDVSLAGTTGSAALRSNFGAITAEDVTGTVEVDGQSGAVRVVRVDAGTGEVAVETAFGGVTVEDVRGRQVSLRSNSGAITSRAVTVSETLTVDTDFGNVDLKDLRAARAAVTTQNGTIEIDGARSTGETKIVTSFGAITLRDVAASGLDVHSKSGPLGIEGARGPLQLATDFGNIDVRAAAAVVLDARTSSGAVRFQGSLDPNASHHLQTDFGDIVLDLPADSAFDIDLSTDYGKVRSDLPVTLSGELADGQWRGRLGAGGPALVATTRNGDIDLRSRSSRPD